MRVKYQRRIKQFAEAALKKRLEAAIAPIMTALPSEIESKMKNEISCFPLPDEESLEPKERKGSRLQSEGREIAGQLFADHLKETLPYLERQIVIFGLIDHRTRSDALSSWAA